MDRRAVLGGIAASWLVPSVGVSQSGNRSEPSQLAALRFQPVAPWVDLVRMVSDDSVPDVFRMRVSGARLGLSAFLHDGRGRLLGMIGSPADAVVEPLLRALDERIPEDGVVDPIETVLWRSLSDRATRAGAWRTADAGVNAVVDAVAGLLGPPSSAGWLVSWSPRHPAAPSQSDLTLGSDQMPELEKMVWELMAEDRLFTFVRSTAIDRFMRAQGGRFVFQTQSMDGLGLGTLVVLAT